VSQIGHWSGRHEARSALPEVAITLVGPPARAQLFVHGHGRRNNCEWGAQSATAERVKILYCKRRYMSVGLAVGAAIKKLSISSHLILSHLHHSSLQPRPKSLAPLPHVPGLSSSPTNSCQGASVSTPPLPFIVSPPPSSLNHSAPWAFRSAGT
jgi:hypothetical protein